MSRMTLEQVENEMRVTIGALCSDCVDQGLDEALRIWADAIDAELKARGEPVGVPDGWFANIAYARDELHRITEMFLPYCDCQPCPECGKQPNDCIDTPCANTCQCSMCDHCRVEEAKRALSDMLAAAPQPPAQPSADAEDAEVSNEMVLRAVHASLDWPHPLTHFEARKALEAAMAQESDAARAAEGGE